jgi:pyroglutamyl-peptidase
MTGILVTGFEPYAGSSENPAALVVKHLPNEIRGIRLVKVVVPCDSWRSPVQVVRAARKPDIRLVLILGEDRRYSLPTVEQVAYNWVNYLVPDNLGRRPAQAPIIFRGPASFSLSLDATYLQQALASRGIRIELADDPERHLCNHVYYAVRYYTDPKPTLLFHLPRLPTQQLRPSLSADDSLRATIALLEQMMPLVGL